MNEYHHTFADILQYNTDTYKNKMQIIQLAYLTGIIEEKKKKREREREKKRGMEINYYPLHDHALRRLRQLLSPDTQ